MPITGEEAINLADVLNRIGDPTADTLASLTAKWGDIARSLDLILGDRWDAGGDLGTDIVAILAGVGIDPWLILLPGLYPPGTAGRIVGDGIDAPISSRAVPGDAMALTVATLLVIQASILSDGTPFPGANIDAAISSRSIPGDAMALTPAERLIVQALVLNDATPFAGALIDAAISSRAPSATALSTAVWTAALATALGNYTALRAGYLDNINNAQLLNIPDLSTLSAARIGYLDNINQVGLLQVTAARAALLDQITAARLGELDAANIPADVDTLKAAIGAIEGATTLHNKLTAARAAFLDAAISSRAAAATALSTAQWTNALATALGNYTAARAAFLDNINNAQLLNIPNLSTLSAARIGYLDNINQAGLLQVTAARAALLDQITAARLGELDAANLPATTDNILLDTQIRKAQSGVKVINAGITKYLHIDSGTNGAEILGIAIEGVVGHDWTLDVYVPAADGEAATQAKSKRDAITYAAADTEGGLLSPFGIPFDCYLDFTNDGANDQIDQVTITYRSRGALTLTWEA